MSFSLPAFRRKWSCRGYMSVGAAMVTVALGLADRAEARKYGSPLDIFGIAAPRPRATVHSANISGKIPLPRPRPEEAPKASAKASDEAPPETGGKPSPDKPGSTKPAEEAPPPEKQASACRLGLTEDPEPGHVGRECRRRRRGCAQKRPAIQRMSRRPAESMSSHGNPPCFAFRASFQ